MGCNVCRQSEPEAKLSNTVALNNPNINMKNKDNYNNFIMVFENNMEYIGKYFPEEDFYSIIPEGTKNYMSDHPFTYNRELNNYSENYNIKPVEFKNGNIYFGSWNDALKMEGKGKYYLKEEGVLAEGFWDNGNLLYARVFLPNGDIYEGEMNNSNFNGKGQLISANGDVYKGDFLNGEKHGEGTINFLDKATYEGTFDNGEFKKGKMVWPNGYEYNGDFAGAKLSGFGMLSGRNGEFYQGNFDNNFFNGEGKYVFENGDTYEGEFQSGVMKGKGVYITKKFEYNGDWNNNLPSGNGQLSSLNKEGIIKCSWRNGQIMENPVYEKGTQNDFDDIDFDIQPPHMNLNIRELSHLEIDENIRSQYKIGTCPSFLED